MTKKNILGVTAGFHDAAVTLIDNTGEILFAGHSERYSKLKNDPEISAGLIAEIDLDSVDTLAYYERPWLKQLRQLYSGQGINTGQLTAAQILKKQLQLPRLPDYRVCSYGHHLSHAAAGFQTSQFSRATVVVIDAIGEFDTASIWAAEYDDRGRAQYRKLWSQQYPHSVGLFYSAMTKRVGLRPMHEEYILMGMAAYGNRKFASRLKRDLVADIKEIEFVDNMHLGVKPKYLQHANDMDIAAGAQVIAEDMIAAIMLRAKQFGYSGNLVYMGGVALNCCANRLLGQHFDNIWIMPNPGDAGSSLGAAALAYGRRLNWQTPYLGHNIPGNYPVVELVQELQQRKIVGVASGRAEFGPRALGNRSLLADPRGPDIKDQVNKIKRRQKFRPFAPVILEELAADYFHMPKSWSTSPYMQVTARVKQPYLFPAITHVDGTARVQTVADDGSGIRQLLECWYQMSGCPMLLNTSLNIRGEPMVNDRADADRFQELYGVRVCS